MSSRPNPFDELERALERMSRSLDADLGEFGGMAAMAGGGPAVDVAEHEGEYVVTADLPGYDRSDLVVEVSGDTLTVGAERDEDAEVERDDYVRRERRHESVRRTVTLPGPVEEDAASARYENGVLTVTLPMVGGGDGGHTIDVE